MSVEKNITLNDNNNISFEHPEIVKKKAGTRVDINDLIARVREERKKENKVNLIFFGLFASLIIVVAIILSF